MKISCHCGQLIYDFETNPDKAYMVSDAVYFSVLEQIDKAIEQCGTSASAKESTIMKVRSLLSASRRGAWQCRHCLRLYIDDPAGNLQCFQPQSSDVLPGVLGPTLD